MTQDAFDDLPLLLTRAEVALCGINDRDIDGLRILIDPNCSTEDIPNGRLAAIQLRGGYHKYLKWSVARLCHLEYR
jgi:hypothetical protein